MTEQVLKPDTRRFEEVYRMVASEIDLTYRVRSSVGDVKDPNTGDFDGESIMVDYTLDAEQRLFVLLHLFGHTVQWNTSEEFRRLGQETVNNATPEQMAKIYVYEQDATRYAIQVLHEVGVFELDQWASDFWQADWEALTKLYTEGVAIDQHKVRDNIRPGKAERLTPIEVPAFTPKKYESRWSF